MKTFTDNAGRAWQLEINVAAVKRVRSLLGVDLLDLLRPDAEAQGRPLMTRLATDVVLRVDVVYALLKPQADRLGVSDEAFGEGLGGEAVLAASEAFFAEIEGFFRGMGRAETVAALVKQAAVLARAAELALGRIERIDPETIVTASGPGTPSTSSPASSGSTPAP